MPRLLIIAQEDDTLAKLRSELIRDGSTCSITPHKNGVAGQIAEQHPDLVMVTIDGRLTKTEIKELTRKLKQENPMPIIALVTMEALDDIESCPDIDDFLTSPYAGRELTLRINRLLRKSEGNAENKELIKCDGLLIDLAKCEVTVEGKIVELTFKEYELLKLLAGNRGRVYTRDDLLNRVWGHDYFGGDRTVDVHIRRLRSKIEDAKHTFIETVRNIGYRFRKDF